MLTNRLIDGAGTVDTELVAQTLEGDRDAFGHIVSRYQSLICSLAYSATGSLGQSEDLAQETFITAWKHLRLLRERNKLRAWLCGIARCLIGKALRRDGHEPAHDAEPLELARDSAATEPLPPERAISREEEAILWRAVERMPESYREPLVLFYREHQSVEKVAAELDLSEDAVKQRLSRGRKLLHEQVLAFVEGALENTRPGKAFTMGVLAGLPILAAATTATAAGVAAAKGSATAAKGGAMAKATAAGAFLQAIAALSPILLLGGFFGFKMGGDARRSPQQRESVATFWRIIVGCLAVFVLVPLLLLIVLGLMPVAYSTAVRARLLGGLTVWLGLMYVVVPAALFLWAWQRRRTFQPQPTREPEAAPVARKKNRFVLWLAIGMIGAAGLLLFGFLDTNRNVQHLTTAEVQKMVVDGKVKQAEFSLLQYQNGYDYFFITQRENGKAIKFMAPANDTTIALVKEHGIKCTTFVQGRDFEVFGWPGRLLPVVCVFILAIGGVVLLRKPGKFKPQEMDAQQTRKMQQVERLANKAFGTGVALVLIAAAILLGLMTRWGIHHISGVEAQQIISASRDVHCEVYQYNTGTGEVWLTVKGTRRPRTLIAPADEPTLALLAEQGITYRTLIQGRDFGFAMPGRLVSLLCISVLAAGAFLILRWVVRKNETFLVPASSQV
jgi:RNA polymerase sigma factor (sigma-70 family)